MQSNSDGAKADLPAQPTPLTAPKLTCAHGQPTPTRDFTGTKANCTLSSTFGRMNHVRARGRRDAEGMSECGTASGAHGGHIVGTAHRMVVVVLVVRGEQTLFVKAPWGHEPRLIVVTITERRVHRATRCMVLRVARELSTLSGQQGCQ
jgi:hypothetical protein